MLRTKASLMEREVIAKRRGKPQLLGVGGGSGKETLPPRLGHGDGQNHRRMRKAAGDHCEL